MSVVVSDSSPLIALCFLKQERLLHQLFGSVLVPPSVASEVARPHRHVGSISVQAIAGVEVRAANDPANLFKIPNYLDPGERDAMALALETRAEFLLIDEIAGREAAGALNISVIGTCGILTLAKGKQLIPSVRPLLDQLRGDLNFYISDALYRLVVADAGEPIE